MRVGDLVRSMPDKRRDLFKTIPTDRVGILVEIYPQSEGRSESWGRVYVAGGPITITSYPLSVLEKVE